MKFLTPIRAISAFKVAPYMGAWIEMLSPVTYCVEELKSLPTWERGLKFHAIGNGGKRNIVAPYMGAWIEIHYQQSENSVDMSLPTWERGLKWNLNSRDRVSNEVAPYMGAWIEIP